ncbi:hypothetical protein N7493_009910 [Penicillium malachiteum]|uniref:WD40 repeat-like protein n=1 Tax=Penicillium malachiteum TaxID=1324776 RepID=A0AAD6HE53_9EURO|nr:hypothetical protein N7493_009910 [Penicillium malachiteum]
MLHSLAFTKGRRQTSGFVQENSAEYAEQVLNDATRLLETFIAHSTKIRNETPEKPERPQEPAEYTRNVTHGHSTFVVGKRQQEIQKPRSIPLVSPTPRPSTTSTPNNVPPNPPRNVTALRIGKRGERDSPRPAPSIQPIPTASAPERPQSQRPISRDHRLSRQSRGTSKESPDAASSPSFLMSPSQSTNDINAPRRSGRTKNIPTTYNVRVLLGIDRPGRLETASTATNDSEVESLTGDLNRASSEVETLATATPTETPAPTTVVAPRPPKSTNISRLLWERELRGCGASNRIFSAVTQDLKPWKSWKGASNDVVALAWSPDSTRFAAGATAQSDEYNRKSNLLLGSLVESTLHELPDHFTRRTAPSTGTEDRLFTSVTDMQWVGDQLYTASYDNTVKIWDVTAGKHPSCLRTLKHDSKVVVMAVSKSNPNLIATGTDGFRLWSLQQGRSHSYLNLDIVRAPRQKAVDLVPTSLQWGNTAHTSEFLIGGMTEAGQHDYKVPAHGHLQLWVIRESFVSPQKVSPDSQNVFDIKWHPSERRFIAATTYSQAMHLPYRTKTVVQLYDYLDGSFAVHDRANRFPCPAADINEATFCPMNPDYLTASCTDGRTYVWDVRKGDRTVHRLAHGEPLHELYDGYSREYTDYGASVALWGSGIDEFYTGGSDGALKRWDIRRSPDDALVSDVATFTEGITCASFSDDKSHMLLGSLGGGVRVVSCAPLSDPDNADFKLKAAPEPPSREVSGRELSKALISNAEIERHPLFGPGQGPKYKGPYARWARGLDPKTPLDQVVKFPLKDEYRIRQLCIAPGSNRLGLDLHALEELKAQLQVAEVRNGLKDASTGQSSSPAPVAVGTKDENQIKIEAAPNPAVEASVMFLGQRKRKRDGEDGQDEPVTKERKRKNLSAHLGVIHIDLTEDSPEPEVMPRNTPPEPLIITESVSEDAQELIPRGSESDDELEDDHWWPESGNYDANICDSD